MIILAETTIPYSEGEPRVVRLVLDKEEEDSGLVYEIEEKEESWTSWSGLTGRAYEFGLEEAFKHYNYWIATRVREMHPNLKWEASNV
jgi:hypothetical protein